MSYEDYNNFRKNIRKQAGTSYKRVKEIQRNIKKETKPGFVRGYKRKYNPKTGWSQVPRSGLASTFLRYFTLFLVCIMLFCIVTGAPYSTYKLAVSAVYGVTETVGGVVTGVAKGVLGITTFVGSGFGLQGTETGFFTIEGITVYNTEGWTWKRETYIETVKFSVQKKNKAFLFIPYSEYEITGVVDGYNYYKTFVGDTIKREFFGRYSITGKHAASIVNGTYTPNETSEGG